MGNEAVSTVCERVWSAGFFLACLCILTAISLLLYNRYFLASLAGFFGAVMSGIGIGASLIERRFR